MPKQFTKFKTSYIISRAEPLEGHWTQYYMGENRFYMGSNWSKHMRYAEKYDDPITAMAVIKRYRLTGAKIEPTEIVGKETFVKEENTMPIKYVIRDYDWSESSRGVSYIRKDQGKYNIYGHAWTTDPKEALEFDTAEDAKEFIKEYRLIGAHVYRRNHCTNREERIDKEDDNKTYGTGTHVFVKSDRYSTPGARIVRKIVDYREKTDEYVAIDANNKYYSIPSYEIIEPVTSDGIISAFEKRLSKCCQNDTTLNFYCAADVSATVELMKMMRYMERKDTMLPEIKKVIFNKPATIVLWADDTKTVVKCQEGEIYDPEKGIAMAIAKKALGNNYEYYNTIKHWLKKAPKVETSRFYCNGVVYTSTKAGE